MLPNRSDLRGKSNVGGEESELLNHDSFLGLLGAVEANCYRNLIGVDGTDAGNLFIEKGFVDAQNGTDGVNIVREPDDIISGEGSLQAVCPDVSVQDLSDCNVQSTETVIPIRPSVEVNGNTSGARQQDEMQTAWVRRKEMIQPLLAMKENVAVVPPFMLKN